MRVMKRVWLCIALGIISILFKGCTRKPVETPPAPIGNVEAPADPPVDPPAEPPAEPPAQPPVEPMPEPMYGVIMGEPEYGPAFPYEEIQTDYGVEMLQVETEPNSQASTDAPVDGLETNTPD